MHHSSLSSKLKPAKRAWQSFTSILNSKLQGLDLPKSLKTTTHRFTNFCALRLVIPFKKRFLTIITGRRRRRHSYNYSCQLYHQYYCNNPDQRNNFSPIFIDNLYSEPAAAVSSSSGYATISRGRNKEVAAAATANDEKGSSSRKGKQREQSVYSVEDAWNAVVASSPQLRCVDERADEFIYKFREDMKIQRERSLLEFHQMLARSS